MRSPTLGRNQPNRPHRGSRGSVTAEFAAVMPAVLLVLVACLLSLQLAGHQLRLQDATADTARSLARGDGQSVAAARLGSMVAGAHLQVSYREDLVCAETSLTPAIGAGLLEAITLRAESCALDGGR